MKNKRIKCSLNLTDISICNNCEAKIYQDEDKHLEYGFGSLLPKVMIVLPPRAYNNSIYENYLNEIFKNILDLDLEYITYHPKCKCEIDFKEYSDKCSEILLYEINKLQPNIIIFFGVKIPEQLYNTDFRFYYFKDIYSIKFDDKLDYFRKHLRKIL